MKSEISNDYPNISDKLIDVLPRKFKDSFELGILNGQQQIIDKLKVEKSYNEKRYK